MRVRGRGGGSGGLGVKPLYGAFDRGYTVAIPMLIMSSRYLGTL